MHDAPFLKATFSSLVVVAVGIIGLPILILLFSTSPSQVYETLLETEVLNSLSLTFACSFIATLIGMILGTPLAYVLARYQFPLKSLLQGLVDLPLVIPHPVAGIALLLGFSIFGRNWSFIGNWSSIVIAMLFVSFPLLVNPLQEAFHSIPLEMEWASRALGVGPWNTFSRVSFPLIRRTLLVGALMMWARGISEFGAIVMLTYNPKVISVLIYDRFTTGGLNAALPVAVVLIWISIVFFVFLRTLQKERGVSARN